MIQGVKVMKFEEIYDKLIILEEEIESCYIKLEEIEFYGTDINDYEYYFRLIRDDCKKEIDYIKQIDGLGYRELLESKLSEELVDSKEFMISLGRHKNAIYYRLKYCLEGMSFDDNLEYITVLKTDRNKIMLAMLAEMLKNDMFSAIKEDLISFKYNLYFMNPGSESDFLLDMENDTVLNSDSYRTNDFPSTSYLDQAILVLPSVDAINYIISVDAEFMQNENIFVKVTLKILMIISSMTLCTEENIHSVLFTINDILENLKYSADLKALLQEMLNILYNIKSRITYKR